MSHFYHLTLPLLITFLAADYGFSPTQLGLFIAGFTSAAAVAQMPVGLLVDRVGAKRILISGLFIKTLAIGAMALTSSYEALLLLAAIAGLGNASSTQPITQSLCRP